MERCDILTLYCDVFVLTSLSQSNCSLQLCGRLFSWNSWTHKVELSWNAAGKQTVELVLLSSFHLSVLQHLVTHFQWCIRSTFRFKLRSDGSLLELFTTQNGFNLLFCSKKINYLNFSNKHINICHAWYGLKFLLLTLSHYKWFRKQKQNNCFSLP